MLYKILTFSGNETPDGRYGAARILVRSGGEGKGAALGQEVGGGSCSMRRFYPLIRSSRVYVRVCVCACLHVRDLACYGLLGTGELHNLENYVASALSQASSVQLPWRAEISHFLFLRSLERSAWMFVFIFVRPREAAARPSLARSGAPALRLP